MLSNILAKSRGVQPIRKIRLPSAVKKNHVTLSEISDNSLSDVIWAQLHPFFVFLVIIFWAVAFGFLMSFDTYCEKIIKKKIMPQPWLEPKTLGLGVQRSTSYATGAITLQKLCSIYKKNPKITN